MVFGSILLILFAGGVKNSLPGVLVGYIICGFTLNVASTSTLVALSMYHPYPLRPSHHLPSLLS